MLPGRGHPYNWFIAIITYHGKRIGNRHKAYIFQGSGDIGGWSSNEYSAHFYDSS